MLLDELIMWDFTFILLIAASTVCLKKNIFIKKKKKSFNLPTPKPNLVFLSFTIAESSFRLLGFAEWNSKDGERVSVEGGGWGGVGG